jgi:hypothetical protein
MTLQDIPLSRRSNEVKDSAVPKYVRKLKGFLGHEALAKAQADLDKDLMHHGRCYGHWLRELRPWLFALRTYDQKTQNGIHMLNKWPTEIREMAGDAFMISSLHHGMPEDARVKYRKDLLTDQHNDFMVEIHAAWHYYLEGFDVQWSRPGQDKCPEFRVRGGGLDFDVECRRFTLDVSEKVKTAAMANTCDRLYEVMLARGLWGEVRVEFGDKFHFDPDCDRRWRSAVIDALDAHQTTVHLDQRIHLTMDLKPSPSPKYTPAELQGLTLDQQHPDASWLLSRGDGESGVDPVVFRCRGPRKTPIELRDRIYKTLKEKVATQLSPERAGVLVVQFRGIRDPDVFNDSQGMKEALAKLFERQHLAAVILKCDGIAETSAASILYSTPSIVVRNAATAFPQVAAANHLSRKQT